MATLATTSLTLADWAKRLDPEGRVPVVAELLSQSNQVLEDAVFVPGNLPTGHRVVIRTGLPQVYWRALNQGVPPSKSTTAQVDEACGMLEAFSEMDVDLAELNGNTEEFRLSEDIPFLEAMNQEMAQKLFYGNPATDPKYFLGLAPRYGAISGAGNAANILDAGGTASDNASIYLVGWNENTVFCPFPKGSKAGLLHEDLGIETVNNADGTRLRAYRTRYQWKNGLVVKDWRYVVRIANIKIGALTSNTSPADIISFMSRACDRIPNFGMCKPIFYVNRTIYSFLRLQALSKSQNAIAVEQGLNQFGTPMNWLSFEGIPIRRVDQLLNTEARVV